jgi:two-component system sensor histidine kinase YesM
MALQNGDKTLSRLIMAMCNMLRYTSRQSSELVPLRDDIAWLRNYLLIMETRQDGRFRAEIDIPESMGDLRVPKLFLQPFAENAILHGFSEVGDEYRLTIRGETQGDFALFSVVDNGRGMPRQKADAILRGEGDSEGIRNVVRRLLLAFGGRASLSISGEEGEGVQITIQIPIESEKSPLLRNI